MTGFHKWFMNLKKKYDKQPVFSANNAAKENLPKSMLPDEEFTHNPLEDAQYQQKLHYGLAYKLHHIAN
jgi:hypothetical protein